MKKCKVLEQISYLFRGHKPYTYETERSLLYPNNDSLPCYLSTLNNLKLYYPFLFPVVSLMPACNFFVCTEATLNNSLKGVT